MAKKPKEQVKFNPDISDAKRFRSVKHNLFGKGYIVLNIICFLFALFMFGSLIIGCGFDTESFMEDDTNVVALFYFCGGYFMVILYAINSILPPTKGVKKANVQMDGCISYYNLFSVLPMEKKSIIKHAFRNFMISASVITVASVVINVFAIVIPEYAVAKSVTGISTLVSSLLLVLVYFTSFIRFTRIKSEKKAKVFSVVTTVMYVVFFIFWFSSTLNFAKNIFAMKAFEVLSGVVGIVISLSAYVVLIAVHKGFIENKISKGSWNND